MRTLLLFALTIAMVVAVAFLWDEIPAPASALIQDPTVQATPSVVTTETPLPDSPETVATQTDSAAPQTGDATLATPTIAVIEASSLDPAPGSAATSTHTPTRTATATATHTHTPTHTPTPKPAATRYPVPTGSIRRIDTTFHSVALGMDKEIYIYLPPGYDAQPQRRYPVWYVLHGWGGFDLQAKHTTEWEQAGLMQGIQQEILKGTVQPMIVVQPMSYLPNNDCSLYFNHGPGTDGKPWGDYIWRDVVNYIDSNYRTIASRDSRAIGGYSFGGQGALSLGLTHPEVFKVIGAHSPSFRAADGSIASMNDPNWYNQFDPIWLVHNTDRAHQLDIWMDVATGDDKVRNCGQGSDRCVEAFQALLTAKGIPHIWHDQWPGPHELSYWQGHLPDYLAWYSSQLVGE